MGTLVLTVRVFVIDAPSSCTVDVNPNNSRFEF